MTSMKTTVTILSDSADTARTFDEASIINIQNQSEYLNEVFHVAEDSDHPQDIILEEKDVNLAAQFLLILAQLADNDPAALPNLSYNLGFADLASKWIVGVYVSYFQNYIKSTLTEICADKPIIVHSTEFIFSDVTGVSKTTKLVPAGRDSKSRVIYNAYECSSSAYGKKRWKLKIRNSEYFFVAKNIHGLLRNTGTTDDWIAAESVINKPFTNTVYFKFEVEKLSDKTVDHFIVNLVQSHEEYKRATSFSYKSLASMLYEYPQLRNGKIMLKLMTREDMIKYLTLTDHSFS
jgi:hypothetical protein